MKNKLIILISVLLLSSSAVFAQEKIDWKFLQGVKFVSMFERGSDDLFSVPRFSKEVTRMDNKEVVIRGYVLPLDADGETYALSANPYAACFFCGGGGIESVMGLWLKNPKKKYKMDEQLSFKGVLMISDIPDHLIYILQDAEEVK